MRVNLELVDPTTRLPVWTSRIERDGADRQGVRDEIVSRIARELQFEVMPIESRRMSKDFNADALAFRGWAALTQIDRQAYDRALALFQQALKRDPDNLSAQIGIGAYHARMGAQLRDTDSPRHRAKAKALLLKALQRDPQSSTAHYFLGLALNKPATLPESMEHLRKVIELSPSNASAYAQIGNGLIRSGHAAEGLAHVRYAMRLSPRDPVMPIWFEFAGNAELELKDYDAAIGYFKNSAELNPDYPRAWAGLAAAYALAGRNADAQDSVGRLKSLAPTLSTEALVRQFGRHKTSRLAEGLRLACIPAGQ
jgi:tetratricopeptide (TPR) repeat protein